MWKSTILKQQRLIKLTVTRLATELIKIYTVIKWSEITIMKNRSGVVVSGQGQYVHNIHSLWLSPWIWLNIKSMQHHLPLPGVNNSVIQLPWYTRVSNKTPFLYHTHTNLQTQFLYYEAFHYITYVTLMGFQAVVKFSSQCWCWLVSVFQWSWSCNSSINNCSISSSITCLI